MNETLTWLSVGSVAVAVALLLAGVGFRRFTVAVATALAIAAAAAAGVGWLVFSVSISFKAGGEWGAIGALAVAYLTALVVFVLCFLLTIVLLAVSRFAIFRRAKVSWFLLAGSFVLLVTGVVANSFNTLQHASTTYLVEQLAQSWMNPDIEDELARRGEAAVVALLAEVHRHPYAGDDESGPRELPPMLRVLGRLGGEEAKAELQRWADSRATPAVRVAAIKALAASGDQAVIPRIVAMLEGSDADCNYERADLLRALGKLHAADRIDVLRETLADRPPYGQGQVLEAAVGALADIGTDEAWTTIATFATDSDADRRYVVVSALREVPGKRSRPVLATALDDADARVREAAFWNLLRHEPRLNQSVNAEWSEANAEQLRQMLRDLENP